ncbi:hypothetical protein DFJ74DRAFT_774304 [Hyaloraphidium curvatum]|nr:hypothetical protein DFJ74DRAFT_774304 [Hyaloraphidium curvatum]
MAPAAASSFTGAEWLALFPAATEPRPALSGEAPPPDPAGPVRLALPLTAATLLDALSPFPALRRFTRLQMLLSPWAVRAGIRHAADFVGRTPLFLLIWSFNDGRFSTHNLAVGTAAELFAFLFVLPAILGAGGHKGMRTGLREAPTKEGELEWDSHWLAGFIRWRQLFAGEEGPGPVSLVQHDPTDPLCPCEAETCAGSLFAHPGAARMADAVLKAFVTGVIGCFFVNWSVLVLGSFWTSGWGPALAVVSWVAILNCYPVNWLMLPRQSIACLKLSSRLRNRAALLAMANLVRRFEPLISGTTWTSPHDFDGTNLYSELHDKLTHVWETRFHYWSDSIAAMLFSVAWMIVPCIIFAVGSYCIPFHAIMMILFLLWGALSDLTVMAASNAEITAVCAAYHRARIELRRLAVRAAESPDAERLRPVAEALSKHDALLSAYMDGDRYKAKYAGFTADYSTVRTVAATLFTVAIGTFTLLSSTQTRARSPRAGRVGSKEVQDSLPSSRILKQMRFMFEP